MATQNLFSQAGGEGENIGLAAAPGFLEQVVEGKAAAMTMGRPQRRNFDRLVPYDFSQGVKGGIPFGSSTNREMSAVEATDRLRKLMDRNGLRGHTDAEKHAFTQAMLLAHAKNSASVITPDRARFWVGVPGQEGFQSFNYYLDILDPLGADARRFFRVFADMTLAIVEGRLAQIDSEDDDIQDDIRHIKWVAADRGLERYPRVIHDSADACSNLTVAERTAIGMGKATIFATKPNAADQVRMYKTAVAASALAGGNDAASMGSSAHAGGPAY
jgi:hypothetical protein